MTYDQNIAAGKNIRVGLGDNDDPDDSETMTSNTNQVNTNPDTQTTPAKTNTGSQKTPVPKNTAPTKPGPKDATYPGLLVASALPILHPRRVFLYNHKAVCKSQTPIHEARFLDGW